ncbi:MAG: isoprenylcysteine carboxylmethyltransferase family protein, partial [Gammaproteobacteria bacterium]|nr:isoprenylcysteine carboxylmethyltransferase family protein [Gammaproteobacteria bacterium]
NIFIVMESINIFDYFVLAVLLILWCSLHSVLISVSVTDYLMRMLGDKYRFYRLSFNIFSLLTLLLIFFYQQSLRQQAFFAWDGYFRILQGVLIFTGLLLAYLGGRKYDASQFLGLTQIKQGNLKRAITQSGDLDTTGILSVVRHPWYLALLLILWSMPLDISMLLVNIVFTVYLFIGACLEERKLILEFGDQYRDYQTRVSMIFPLKWLRNYIR